jgi:predicted kinase
MLIALFGPPGAGKDTVAKRLVELHGFVRIAFADKVRELAYETLPVHARDEIDKKGWDDCKRMADNFYREHLERVGYGARKVLGDDVWIKAVERQVMQLLAQHKNVVITDLRKRNELDFVHKIDWSCGEDTAAWHVTRPGCEKRPFDEWKPDWASFTIHNNDTIEVLNQQVDEVLELCQ